MSWWRSNRWGLALLPVALVTAAVASSSRVQDYWWDKGFHDAQRAGSDGVAHLDQAVGPPGSLYRVDTRVRLVGAERTTSVPGRVTGETTTATLPRGGALWRLRLHFDAAPSVVMTGCQVALVDHRGRRFESNRDDVRTDGTLPLQLCAPDATPGPEPALGQGEPSLSPGDLPRPAAYDTDVYVVTADDATPTVVRVWWQLPVYAELAVRGS
jgi:hypothetical protein